MNLVYCGCESMVANDEKEVVAVGDVAEDPKYSERLISGGERSEETGICFAGVLMYGLFAMLASMGVIVSELERLVCKSASGRPPVKMDVGSNRSVCVVGVNRRCRA